MDYFQYYYSSFKFFPFYSFKPYYKWITFNISLHLLLHHRQMRFKPYYKWITFNIVTIKIIIENTAIVLNLIINGLLSIWTLKN